MASKLSREVDLGKEPIGSLLFTLAVPAITSQVVNVLYNMVDRMYIGHIEGIGATALTGVGVAFPIIMIISAFAALMGMGGAPRASILMGKKNNEGAEQILGNCFSALFLTSIVLTIVVLVFQEPLLMLFGASSNTIGYAKDYMSIYALGTIFVQMTLGLNNFISAQGFSKISMLTVIIGAVTNIVLDPIFIFGFHMGVSGAALATIISQAVSAVWAIRFLSAADLHVLRQSPGDPRPAVRPAEHCKKRPGPHQPPGKRRPSMAQKHLRHRQPPDPVPLVGCDAPRFSHLQLHRHPTTDIGHAMDFLLIFDYIRHTDFISADNYLIKTLEHVRKDFTAKAMKKLPHCNLFICFNIVSLYIEDNRRVTIRQFFLFAFLLE